MRCARLIAAFRFQFSPFSLITDRAYGPTVEAVEAVPVEVDAVEVQVVSVVAAIAARRPVETLATSAVDFRTDATARSGEEDAIAVRAGDGVTGDGVTVYAEIGRAHV